MCHFSVFGAHCIYLILRTFSSQIRSNGGFGHFAQILRITDLFLSITEITEVSLFAMDG